MLIYLDIKIPHLQIAHQGGNLEVGNIKMYRIWRLPSVTLASSFINSNLVWTRIVGSLLQSYCKCCRGRPAVPSCNHHHRHYQHNHYHYYLHKYYHCHYTNNGLHEVIIREVKNQDFILTTANTVLFLGSSRPPNLTRWFMFYLNSSFIPWWTIWPTPFLLLGFG